jgi:hypothetical protein
MSMIACEVCTTLLDTDDVESVVWGILIDSILMDAPLCVDCAEEVNGQEVE